MGALVNKATCGMDQPPVNRTDPGENKPDFVNR